MPRKHYTTTISTAVKTDFANKCKSEGYKQNDVLEKLMQLYSDGKIVLTKKTSFDVEMK